MVIHEKWVVIGLACAIFLYFFLCKREEGFQNTTVNTDVKSQVCTILRDTYNSVKFNYDNMDKANVKNKDVVRVHLEGIQQQIAAQGC